MISESLYTDTMSLVKTIIVYIDNIKVNLLSDHIQGINKEVPLKQTQFLQPGLLQSYPLPVLLNSCSPTNRIKQNILIFYLYC